MTSSSTSHSSPKAFLAAFASALIPGAGQFIAGKGRRGAVLLVADIAFLAALRFFFRDGVPYLTEGVTLDNPQTTFMLMLGLIVPLALRIWAADDAYRSVTGGQPNAVVATFASAVVPGLGQLIVSDHRKGAILLAIDTVILAVIALFFRDELTIATHWLKPTSMALMMIANSIRLGHISFRWSDDHDDRRRFRNILAAWDHCDRGDRPDNGTADHNNFSERPTVLGRDGTAEHPSDRWRFRGGPYRYPHRHDDHSLDRSGDRRCRHVLDPTKLDMGATS
jgi:TM2 domain-containing membrane protein YozV